MEENETNVSKAAHSVYEYHGCYTKTPEVPGSAAETEWFKEIRSLRATAIEDAGPVRDRGAYLKRMIKTLVDQNGEYQMSERDAWLAWNALESRSVIEPVPSDKRTVRGRRFSQQTHHVKEMRRGHPTRLVAPLAFTFVRLCSQDGD